MLSCLLSSGYYDNCVQETRTKEIYPVTLCEVKRHLRIDNDFVDDDAYLESLIQAATTMAENYIDKSIAKTLTEVRIDDFSGDFIKIFDGNFINVVSVLDSSDVSIGTIHQTSKHDDYFSIEWNDSFSSDPLKISYYAGFNEDATPALLKQAVLIKIADLYDSQRASLNWSGLINNRVFEEILNYYKNYRF